jgi:hypothetical protein
MKPEKYVKKGMKLLKNIKKVLKKTTAENYAEISSKLRLGLLDIEKHIEKNVEP